MKKIPLSPALALAICLSLSLPVLAADRPQSPSAEVSGNYTLVRQGEEANQEFFAAQPVSLVDSMGDDFSISGYNTVTENTQWTLTNTASDRHVYLEVHAEQYGFSGVPCTFTFTSADLGETGMFSTSAAAAHFYSGQSVSFRMADILQVFEGTASSDVMYMLYILQGEDGADGELAGEKYYLKMGPSQTVPSFTDVAADSPYRDAIKWAVEQGITNGKTSTTFGPGDTCTVSHILTFLYRAAGSPKTSDNEQASVTAWAQGLGIDTGNLSAPCTRAAAVTYLWKVAGSPAPDTAIAFDDVSAGADYAGAVAWAVEQGITTGTSAATFSPVSTCTRGQIVTFLYRAK